MMKFPKILAALLLISGQAAQAQDVTAENVAQVVAERMVIAEQTSLTIDGVEQSIDEVELARGEGSLQLVMTSQGNVFVAGIDALMNGDDSITSIPSIVVLSDGAGGQFEGALPIVEMTDDGVIKVSGTVTADGQSPLEVTAAFSEASIGRGNVKIEVLDDRFVLSGTLGWGAYDTLRTAIANHPDIKLLELTQAPGSADDEINMHTARLVRNAGISTFVADGSRIASGAVDLFSSGVERFVEPGAIVGVHSWCCSDDGTPVADLPHDDPAHAAQLAYFTEMLGPVNGPDFYFYTLNAAPAEDIYPMPIEDMEKFNLITGLR